MVEMGDVVEKLLLTYHGRASSMEADSRRIDIRSVIRQYVPPNFYSRTTGGDWQDD